MKEAYQQPQNYRLSRRPRPVVESPRFAGSLWPWESPRLLVRHRDTPLVRPPMKIQLPSHCAHAKECSLGAPGNSLLTSSVASTNRGAESGRVVASARPSAKPTMIAV